MGCAARLGGLALATAVFIMGVVTVTFPSTHHYDSTRQRVLTELLVDFLFMTRAGGVVLILFACGILFATLRRK